MSTPGRVLDWSIEGLKTLSGATGSHLEDDWQDQTLPAEAVSGFLHNWTESHFDGFINEMFHSKTVSYIF